MKKLLIAAMLILSCGQVSAQALQMRDVFKQMPDSLMPYLSQNNRLDFIDFLDSGMRAEVKNQLGGTSEMTALSDDALTIRMNESLRVDMFLMETASADSTSHTIVMIETFLTDSIHGESVVKYYTPEWIPLTEKPQLQVEQEKRINEQKLQNILKREEELLNKS